MIEALVVGGVDYAESDRVVHLLTDHGRLSLFAHGAKKSRKRFGGALEPFTTIRVQLEDRKKGGLQVMTSAEVIAPRLGIRSDLLRIALASYVAELGAALAPEGDAALDLYRVVIGALDHLDRGPMPLFALRQAFELSLMSAIGYSPSIDRCVECGGAPSGVDFVRGGALCSEHREGAAALGPKTRAWIEGVISSGFFDERGGLDDASADLAARKMSRSLFLFYRSLLERPLKSEALLDGLLRV